MNQGKNQIVVALGACDSLTAEAVSWLSGGRSDSVGNAFAGFVAAMALGRKMGSLTGLNPAPIREDFPPSILGDVDVLIPNETEFLSILKILHPDKYTEFSEADLWNLSGKALHETCRSLGVPTVILTMGAKGVFLSTPDRFRQFPALSGINTLPSIKH